MPIKNLLERNAYTIAITLTVLIAVLSLISLSGFNLRLGLEKVGNSDKIGHFIAYFLLSLSWFFALKFDKKARHYKLFIVSALIGYGTILEVIQHEMTTYRTGDPKDILANSLGIITAVITFKKLNTLLNSKLK